MNILLLFLVPGLPLLLAIPALRLYLPWSCYIALLPALIIVVFNHQLISIDIPWLLFGTTFAIDAMSRVLLIMTIIVWSSSAAFLYKSSHHPCSGHFTSYFMLTLAGNLGTILAHDLMTFYVFLTLTGYAFYALVVSGNKDNSQHSGRIYLSFMIAADLVLFEALLLAAVMADDLGFSAVHSLISQSSSSTLYMLTILFGFAIKAGLWPLHFWLSRVFCSSRPAVMVLLAGVPIAIALLGMLRWLPLGEITSPELGMGIQGLGMASIFYVIIFTLIRRPLQILAVNVVIIAAGLYITALGTVLVYPALWKQYEYWFYYFLTSFGIGFAVLIVAYECSGLNVGHCVKAAKQPNYLISRLERFPALMSHYWNNTRIIRLFCKVNYRQYRLLWEKIVVNGEHFLQRWNIAITLLLLLWLVVVIIQALPYYMAQ